jgi:hypothetical protein
MALVHFKREIGEQARALVFKKNKRVWRTARTKGVCSQGHRVEGDNVKIQNRTEHRNTARLCRICYLASRKRGEQRGVIGEARLRRIITAVDDHGASISNLTNSAAARAIGIKVIVSRVKLMAFANNKDPRLGRLGRLILKRAEDNAVRQKLERRKLVRVVAAPFVLRNDGADAHEAIQRATAHIWVGECRRPIAD